MNLVLAASLRQLVDDLDEATWQKDPLMLTLLEVMLGNYEKGWMKTEELTQMAFDPLKYPRLKRFPKIIQTLLDHDIRYQQASKGARKILET